MLFGCLFSVPATAVATIMMMPPDIMAISPHDAAQPFRMEIADNARAIVPEVTVTSCGASFLVIYKCMAMPIHARIAAACATKLVVTELNVASNGPEGSVNADGRLRGKYLWVPKNWLHGKKTEATFNDAPTITAYKTLFGKPFLK
jgi:hypothetical protein